MPGHLVDTNVLKGIGYNANGCHPKPQALTNITTTQKEEEAYKSYSQANISFIIHCFEENKDKHTVTKNLNW